MLFSLLLSLFISSIKLSSSALNIFSIADLAQKQILINKAKVINIIIRKIQKAGFFERDEETSLTQPKAFVFDTEFNSLLVGLNE